LPPLLIFGEETPHWRGAREFLLDALANDLSGIGAFFSIHALSMT
jgi:hypothetical protein